MRSDACLCVGTCVDMPLVPHLMNVQWISADYTTHCLWLQFITLFCHIHHTSIIVFLFFFLQLFLHSCFYYLPLLHAVSRKNSFDNRKLKQWFIKNFQSTDYKVFSKSNFTLLHPWVWCSATMKIGVFWQILLVFNHFLLNEEKKKVADGTASSSFRAPPSE